MSCPASAGHRVRRSQRKSICWLSTRVRDVQGDLDSSAPCSSIIPNSRPTRTSKTTCSSTNTSTATPAAAWAPRTKPGGPALSRGCFNRGRRHATRSSAFTPLQTRNRIPDRESHGNRRLRWRERSAALPSGIWTSGWIYFTAPISGMFLAVEIYRGLKGLSHLACPKYHHGTKQRCIFCAHPGQAKLVAKANVGRAGCPQPDILRNERTPARSGQRALPRTGGSPPM